MATFGEIQARVQTRVIDLRSAVSAEIPTFINEAIDALTAIHSWKCMMAEQQYLTNHNAANSQILGQLPADWKEPRGGPYWVAQLGYTREMTWLPNRTYAYRAWVPFGVNNTGPPRQLLMGEATNDTLPDPNNPDLNMASLNLEVYPRPDGLSDWNTSPGGEYRIRVPYWRNFPALVAANSTNWFTNNATQFLVDYATCRAFMLDWDEQRAAIWKVEAWGPRWDGSDMRTLGGSARFAFNRDKSMTYAPGGTLVPRRDVFAERDQWRT